MLNDDVLLPIVEGSQLDSIFQRSAGMGKQMLALIGILFAVIKEKIMQEPAPGGGNEIPVEIATEKKAHIGHKKTVLITVGKIMGTDILQLADAGCSKQIADASFKLNTVA